MEIIKNLKAAGLQPNFHILDNEVSTDLIAFLKYDEKITVQLAPDGCHRRNAAVRATRTFKNHFIAGLCTAHQHFPLNKWDGLLPQSFISLNILRTSRLNPKLFAHTLLNELYDFNATPMAPLGAMILVHEKTRPTWHLGRPLRQRLVSRPRPPPLLVLPRINCRNAWGTHRRHSSMVFHQGPNANVLVNGLGHC